MRIYTPAGDLAFSAFNFPDGQPHIKVETHEIEFRSVTVETAIRNPTELLQTLLVSQVLRQQGYSEVNLDIRYLLGARMDRAIGPDQPFTLEYISRLINGAGFSRVRILDVHSEVATRLIRNSTNITPIATISQVLRTVGPTSLVCPDAGSVSRFNKLYNVIGTRNTLWCHKYRNTQSGQLGGFVVPNYNPNPNAQGTELLIVDDICDGGGTFVGLAKELRKAGTKKVFLYVTHGIFSKDLPLEGVDRVFTTDSYRPQGRYDHSKGLTTIPISMKDIK